MPFEADTQVYTVRLWRERRKRAESEELWRGRVELLLTSEGIYFQDMEKLVSFIIRTSGAAGMAKRSAEGRARDEKEEGKRRADPGSHGKPPGPRES